MRLVIVNVLLLTACKQTDEAQPDVTTREPFAGHRVTIGGEVEALLDPRSFTLDTQSTLWTKPVRVVGELPIRFAGEPPRKDDVVIVTGAIGAAGEIHAETIRYVREEARWAADPAKSFVGVLAILNAADAVSLIGQPVKYQRVRVQRVDGATLWVGPNAERSVLVVPDDAALLEGVRAGAHVEIEGTIRQMPRPREARSTLGVAATISDDRIAREHVYIDVTDLELR